MNAIFPYLAKASVILTFLYLVYWIFLRKEVYVRFTRFYLVCSLIISLIIPFISFNVYQPANEPISEAISSISTVQQYLDVDTQLKEKYFIEENPVIHSIDESSMSNVKMLALIYLAGVAIFIALFLVSFINVMKIIVFNRCIKMNGYNLVRIKKQITPFSFFRFIFINDRELSAGDLKNILEHEKVHVRQWHSIDVLFAEIFKILLWFNPVVYLLKNSLKSVHEYIADKHAIMEGCNLLDYQSSMLKQIISARSFKLANTFNTRLVKERLAMMHLHAHIKWSKTKIISSLILTSVIVSILTCNFVIQQKDQYVLYHDNGIKKFEGEMKNNKLSGDFTYWDDEGKVTFTGIFDEQGFITGIERTYQEGIRSVDFYYEHDTMKCFAGSWFANGRLDEEIILSDNNSPGKKIRYYESGVKYEEVDYDTPEGRRSNYTLYNENGEIAFQGYYDNHILYRNDDKIAFTGDIAAYFNNGHLARKGHYQAGIPTGIESEWFSTGQIRTEIDHISVTRSNIQNWKITGEKVLSGNLTYPYAEYYSPFAIEREWFLFYTFFNFMKRDPIAEIKNELAGIIK